MKLTRLTIDDFGLIEHAEVAFGDGLTVFSGETGSGKTMLLGALDFALGARTGAEMIRTGAQRTRVTLEVEPDEAIRAMLDENGVEAEDDAIVVLRELAASGRSSARINGVAVSAGQLRALAELLVETIGQHEAQRLLSPAYQLELLDRLGDDEVGEARARVAAAHERFARLRRELETLRADEGQALAAYDFARFALNEIDDAKVEPGEDERLRERRDYLANAERIAGALAGAHASLAGEDGAVDALGDAASVLAAIARYAERLAAASESLARLQAEANEIALELAREQEGAEYDPAELETIAARLETLDRLKKKYGGTIEAVEAARGRFASAVDAYASRDERLAELERETSGARAELDAAADALHALRASAAERLEAEIVTELRALAMPSARFTVALERHGDAGPNGDDRCEFRLAPNPGEAARPLAKSASGGELSRVLLALVVVLAGRRARTAIVFDEVDAGIGGATANAVGLRLGRLAATAQVVLVTHLAQIASWADAHFALRKAERRGVTTVGVVALSPDQRQKEIARMLAGDTREVALDHARTLLAEIEGRKLTGSGGS